MEGLRDGSADPEALKEGFVTGLLGGWYCVGFQQSEIKYTSALKFVYFRRINFSIHKNLDKIVKMSNFWCKMARFSIFRRKPCVIIFWGAPNLHNLERRCVEDKRLATIIHRLTEIISKISADGFYDFSPVIVSRQSLFLTAKERLLPESLSCCLNILDFQWFCMFVV